MNSKYSVILAILVVLTAMAAAGCTTTTTSPSVTATPAASQAPATSSATATAKATTPASSVPSLDFNSLKALEYKITSVEDGQSTSMNMRWEYTATEVHMKITSEGTTVMDMTVPVDQASSTQESGSLSEAMNPDFESKLISAGTDVVTVPKGTFTCTKYTVTEGNAIGTYWLANNVPVPVKMTQSEDGKETMSMELVDYQV